MSSRRSRHRNRTGHTLMELVVAMAASAFLLVGMGSVMYIGREVAYTPSGTTKRAKGADVVGQICDELRYATYVIQQTPQILEFVIADRNSDGADERIRYEWSGVAGAPLRKSVNGGSSIDVLPSVNLFTITLQQSQKATTLNTKVESAESVLLASTAVSGTIWRDIDLSNWMAQSLVPSAFSSVPANAMCWNLTRFEFYGDKNGPSAETLTVQIRPATDYYNQPAGNPLGEANISELALTNGWNTVTFPTPIKGLAFNRTYNIVFLQKSGATPSARVAYNDLVATGITDSTDGGASWSYMPSRQMWGRVYGTYTTPGPSYTVTRNYVSSVRIALQSGSQGFARIDASAPLRNTPELLASYWRTDFGRDECDNDHPPGPRDDPTTANTNGDGVADWVQTGGGTFDRTKLRKGIWTPASAIETRPLNNFATTTIVEACCRNTSTGGNGAVLQINADRQGGQYAPLLVYLQRQANGTQTLSLVNKTSDAATKTLFSQPRLSSGFIRYRLTILPNNNVVNLQINGEDQGTYSYSTYAPSTATDGYVTLFANTSSAEFDYADIRVGTN